MKLTDILMYRHPKDKGKLDHILITMFLSIPRGINLGKAINLDFRDCTYSSLLLNCQPEENEMLGCNFLPILYMLLVYFTYTMSRTSLFL